MLKLKTSALMALLVILIAITAIPATTASPEWCKPKVPSEEEIFGWIEDLWEIGYGSEFGWRMPGTAADHEGAEYVLEKFEEFGLENTFLEPTPIPVWMPDEWRLTVQYTIGGEEVEEAIPCGYMPWATFTGPEGITDEMVYVGKGTEEDFIAKDVKDKIVLVDVYSFGVPAAVWDAFALFKYDPENVVIPEQGYPLNWPVANMDSTYQLAIKYEAAGYIGILDFMVGDMNTYWFWYVPGIVPISGLYVSPNDGAYLRSLLAAGSVEANMLLRGRFEPNGVMYNVYGFLPGKTDEIITVTSHHDGWATNEALGMSDVMALAKYFAQVPKCFREKTLLFIGIAGHFAVGRLPFPENLPVVKDLLPKIVAEINLEMTPCKEYVYSDDRSKFVETGNVLATGYFVSGPWLSANPCLLAFGIEAITKHELAPSTIIPGWSPMGIPGEGSRFFGVGIPTIQFQGGPAHQFTPEDTPDKVAKDRLVATAKTFIDIINWIDATPAILMKTYPPIISVPPELYLGSGWMSTDESYLGKGVLYATDEVIYLGVEESGWIAWDTVQQWEYPNKKVYKCQSEWGTLWVHTYKEERCLAIGPVAFFTGKAV